MMPKATVSRDNSTPKMKQPKSLENMGSSPESLEYQLPALPSMERKKRKFQQNSLDIIDSDEEKYDVLGDWNTEIKKIVHTLQSKIHSAVQTKSRKISAFASETLLQNITNISETFNTTKEKSNKLSTSLSKQYFDVLEEMEKEQYHFNSQVEKTINVIEEFIKSNAEYKTSQLKKLEKLHEIGVNFFKAMDKNSKELKQECDTSLNKFKKGVQSIQKNI